MAIFFNFSNGNFHFKNESFHFLSFQISKMKSFIFFISNFLGIFQKFSFPFGGMAKKNQISKSNFLFNFSHFPRVVWLNVKKFNLNFKRHFFSFQIFFVVLIFFLGLRLPNLLKIVIYLLL
jgi:hypothetical protein